MVALKVYLETTVFNRYFEDGREYSIETKILFGMLNKTLTIQLTSTLKWALFP